MSISRPVRHCLQALVFALPMHLSAMEGTAATVEFQSKASITSAAEDFVTALVPMDKGDRRVVAAAIDSRIRLRQCAKALETFAAPGSVPTIGRSVVGVRCRGPVNWKIYVGVTIERQDSVVVVRHHMNRGDLLASVDLDVVQMQVSRLGRGYYRLPAAAIGKRLKQAIGAGEPLSPALLSVANIVKRGQQVTLAAGAAGVGITVLGVAAMDGAMGDRIRVKNLSSGRQVEGIVRSPQIIEVLGF